MCLRSGEKQKWERPNSDCWNFHNPEGNTCHKANTKTHYVTITWQNIKSVQKWQNNCTITISDLKPHPPNDLQHKQARDIVWTCAGKHSTYLWFVHTMYFALPTQHTLLFSGEHRDHHKLEERLYSGILLSELNILHLLQEILYQSSCMGSDSVICVIVEKYF